MFKLEIITDNAAFEDGPAEVARILRNLADRYERGEDVPIRLMDYNGNKVGFATDDSE